MRKSSLTPSQLNDNSFEAPADYLQPEILRGSGALALGASVPTQLMVWWAAALTVLTLLYAVRTFSRRA